jgi:hypothetical protein
MSWGKLAEQITTVFKSTNFPTGVEADIGEGPNVESKFPDFLDWCTSLKIPIVVAAGNSPNKWLHQQVPHKFGKPDNLIVTVGGVEPDGMLYLDTTPAQPGNKDSLSGPMSVYAPARDVKVPSDGVDVHTGTSQAAAIVVSTSPLSNRQPLTESQSGLIAYFYSLPQLDAPIQSGKVDITDNAKNFLLDHAWTRVPVSKLGAVHLATLDVVYNLARGDTEHLDKFCFNPVKRGESASGCSLAQSSTSSTSSMSSRSIAASSMSTK